MKDIETVVSDNIKKLLEEYNLSHSKLATIAGVSVSTVGKWVLKKATPRMGAVQKISDHFNIPKAYILKEEDIQYPKERNYPCYPSVSAGVPVGIDGITELESETITVPDYLLGKWSGNRDIYFTRTNGESMNNVMPHNSLIAVKHVELHELNDNDIVVYRNHGEYAVKRFERHTDKLVFRPDSTDRNFTDDVIYLEDATDLTISGKVVMHTVIHD